MVNIKLSSSGWESKNKRSDFAKSFVYANYDAAMQDKVKSFDTQDPNIQVYADDTTFALEFVKREYFQNTTQAITRLQEIAAIETRFVEFVDSL